MNKLYKEKKNEYQRREELKKKKKKKKKGEENKGRSCNMSIIVLCSPQQRAIQGECIRLPTCKCGPKEQRDQKLNIAKVGTLLMCITLLIKKKNKKFFKQKYNVNSYHYVNQTWPRVVTKDKKLNTSFELNNVLFISYAYLDHGKINK